MKAYFLQLTLLLLALLSFSSTAKADGSDTSLWSYQLSYHNATATLAVGNTVYALCNGNLLAYDTEDGSVTTYDRLSAGLNSKNISYFGYSSTCRCLVLLYADQNIDLLYDDGTVVNLPEIKDYSETTISVNNLNVNGNYATVSTTEGVILIDVKNEYIRGYYRIEQNVRDAIVSQDQLYASLNNKIISGRLTNNLYDLSQWTDAYTTIRANAFVGYGDGVYFIVPYIADFTDKNNGIYYLSPKTEDGTRTLSHVSYLLCDGGNVNGNLIQLYGSQSILILNPETPTETLSHVKYGKYVYGLTRTQNGKVFVAEKEDGLKGYTLDDTPAFVATGEVIGNFGPRYDLAYRLLFTDNTLYVCGGNHDYLGVTLNPSFLGRYRGGEWYDMDAGAAQAASHQFYNMVDVAVNPSNTEEVYSVSFGSGLYKYNDGKLTTLYHNHNSPLRSMYNNNRDYVRLGGCSFDEGGNLWISTSRVDTTLTILKKDQTWTKLYVSSFNNQREVANILHDSRGYVWVNARNEGGLLGLNYNGTIDNDKDDNAIYRTSIANEDGTTCDILNIKSVVEDRNGQIWFGCSSGVYAIEDPTAWFSSSFTLYQPKVPRNDGTNYADYLLTGITVSAIAVDGGNRKWIGTLGGGLYLVSADGSEVIEHITSDDTPLLSDNIYSLAIDHDNGILYIGTDLGLCIYRAGTTSPSASLEKDLIKVYPNPVRAEYHGNVSITGLTSGAEVKIVSASGQLVARGNATGGSYLWDCCSSSSGNRVAPGVYFILVSTADGKTSVGAKVAVI